MAVLTGRQKATRATDESSSVDGQRLRERVREVEAGLRGLEGQLAAAEGERDAAEAVVAAVKARSGGSVELWRAEESYDAAVGRTRELLGQLAPLKAEHARLSGYLAPIDRELAELDTCRRGLAAWEKLAEVLPLIDKIAAVVDAAREAGVGTGVEFEVPEPIRYLVRQLGPKATGTGRQKVEYAIRSNVTGKRERLARSGGES